MKNYYGTVVIGGGQAGLACGYELGRRGEDYVILDEHARTGDSWRTRWEGLRLFSPNRYNALPGMPPPGAGGALPDRLDLADYLETYARRMALNVTHRCTCVRAEKKAEQWEVQTTAKTLQADRLIVATGAYRDPFVPGQLAAMFGSEIEQRHSSEIRAVEPFANVLIIGAGASGQQLARLYSGAGADVTLVGSEVQNLPREVLGKDVYWWLYRTGLMTLRTDSWLGRTLIQTKGGTVTVGEPPVPPAITRIEARLEAYREGKLHFGGTPTPLEWPRAAGRSLIVWCTGYRNRFPFLPARFHTDGRPLHDRGVSTLDRTLAFVGLENLLRINSSLVGGAGRDAAVIVSKLLSSSVPTAD